MPVSPTYPGVYIEEIPSGVRTITGVATSITAFVGRCLQGPVSVPTTITNFSDFERQFGGLDPNFPLSYAVRDFYANGGGQGVILRLFTAPGDGTTGVSEAELVTGADLRASSPGEWGDRLSFKVDYDGITADVASRFDLDVGDMFNLSMVVNPPGPTAEVFLNVSLASNAGSRSLDRVLENESKLVRLSSLGDNSRPPATVENEDPTNNNATAVALFDGGSDGGSLNPGSYTATATGLNQLKKTDLFNLLCIPPDTPGGDTDASVYTAAAQLCVEERAFLIVDPPAAWDEPSDVSNLAQFASGLNARNAAVYFPRVRQPDPLRQNQLETYVPCGIIAGLMARTDAQRGVWKAPAGTDASLNGVQELPVKLTDAENGLLNPQGVNCLRSFPVTGRVAWGARTLRGSDQLADEYKYIPVRRLALFIEESLFRGTQWVVFEPNDEPLWAQIRLNVGAFMHNLFRQGAFQGSSPKDAYLVKCDSETTTQNDINLGIVNVVVGFAPLKPAEFVIIKLQQLAGQIEA